MLNIKIGYLIGNKSDLDNYLGRVNSECISEFSTNNNLDYFECSVKENLNILEIFESM
ncbi:hypothetical protein A3Q56_07768 [Intoshia linei]|uniref:Uncharacterized protein n=1 Tax=Intoshia linei TaxID=1819745 RepID=A0A177AR97_9BILA|nr:hypothetical protein A3Q56_07768 [Intoshia linei]